jgi:branched-chain amino acid transport system substrate-binding protein
MTGSRSRWLLVAAALGVSLIAATGVSQAAATRSAAALPSTCAKPIGSGNLTIVTDVPEQGSLRLLATEINKAAALVLKQANYKAGKYTVQLVTCDDSTAQAGSWDSATCTSNAKGYARVSSVVGEVGTFNSGCAVIEAPILNRAPGGGVAMVSPANTYVGLTRPSGVPGEPQKYYPSGHRNYARVAIPDNYQGAADALFAQSKGWKKIYVLNDGETYGAGIATNFVNAAKSLGITILGNDKWDKTAPNYQAEYQKIQGTNPDAVFLGGIISNNGGQLIKDKVAVLGDNTKVALMGPDGFNTTDTITGAGAAAEGMYVTIGGASPNDLTNATGKAFIKAFKSTYKVNTLQAYTGYGAESMQVLLAAIAKSNGTRADIVKHLYNLTVPNSILGPAKIDQFGDPVYGTGANKGGQVTIQQIKGQNIVTIIVEKPPASLAAKALA